MCSDYHISRDAMHRVSTKIDRGDIKHVIFEITDNNFLFYNIVD